MIKTRSIARGAAALILAASFVSCNNDFGIFKTVQQEVKQAGAKVFQKTTTRNAFKLGSYYYAATTRLYRQKTDGSSSWDLINVTNGGTYTIRGVVLTGTTIYVLVGNSSTDIALFSSTDGASWSGVALPIGSVFDDLYSANGELYAENHAFDGTTSTYTLYHYAAGSFAAIAGFAPAANKTIRGVAYLGGATPLYWFASEDLLYSSSNADGTGATDASVPFANLFPSNSIWSISTSGSYLYIGTQGGTLYRFQSGTPESYSLASLPLTQVIEIPARSGTELLVGTDTLTNTSGQELGYYEGNFPSMFNTGGIGAVTSTEAIYSTTVKTFPIHAFYFDAAANRLFVCASPGTSSSSNYGLYSSIWDPAATTWSGWKAVE